MSNYWGKRPARARGEVIASRVLGTDYVIQPGDFFVAVDATAGSVDVFLPPAAESQGRLLLILPRGMDPNQVAFVASVEDAAPDINGYGPTLGIAFTEAGRVFFVECNGASWTARAPVRWEDIVEVLGITDLADVDGITGTGATVVFNLAPTLFSPIIQGFPTGPGFTNAPHDHSNAANGGQLDHGAALVGLADDDHSQYALLAGRAGGQSLSGGTGSTDVLTLKGSSFSPVGGAKIALADTLALTSQPNDPAVTGEFARRSALLKYNDGTAVRTLLHDNSALGGELSGTHGNAVMRDGSTSQDGALQLDADNGGVATRAVKGDDTRLLKRGTAFPTSPADGWHFYRTDHDELYFYDGTRAKWLSVRAFEYDGSHTNVNATYLNMPGGPAFSSTIGYALPYDMVLCEIHVANATNTNGTFRVRADGSNVSAVSQALGSGVTTDINDNYTAGQVVAFFTSSNISSGCHMKGIFRRRAS